MRSLRTSFALINEKISKKLKKVLTNTCEYGIILLVVDKTASKYALLAQLVEHLTLNQGVRGSSPRWRTKTI